MAEAPKPLAEMKTRELVHYYAAMLLDQGVEVKQSAITDKILAEHGVKASPNMVGEEIKKFWAVAGPALSERLRRPGIPDDVVLAFEEIWRVALDAATSRHEAERKAMTSERDQAVDAFNQAAESEAKAHERLELQLVELAGLREDKVHFKGQLEALTGQCREHQDRADELRDKLADLEAVKSAEFQRLSDSHGAELARLQAAHQDEVARLKGDHEVLQNKFVEFTERAEQARAAQAVAAADQLERTENHLMMETVRVRDEAKGRVDKLAKELEHALSTVDSLRVQRSKANDEAAEARGRFEEVARTLARSELECQRLAEQLSQQSQQTHALQVALLSRLADGPQPAPSPD